MRYLLVSFSMLFILNVSFSQKTNPDSSPVEVAVQNWNETAYYLPAGYWNESRSKEITDQIGKEEFEKVKKYSDSKNIPCPFLIFCNGRKQKLEALKAKLERLHVYEVASYRQYNSSGDFKGMYSVLAVPYQGNENWDPSVKWDTVYFIIQKKLVHPITQ